MGPDAVRNRAADNAEMIARVTADRRALRGDASAAAGVDAASAVLRDDVPARLARLLGNVTDADLVGLDPAPDDSWRDPKPIDADDELYMSGNALARLRALGRADAADPTSRAADAVSVDTASRARDTARTVDATARAHAGTIHACTAPRLHHAGRAAAASKRQPNPN